MAFLATACGGSGGTAAAAKACSYVSRASRLEQQARVAPAPAARRLRDGAEQALERAEPYAMDAAAADGNWQALSANLGEIPSNPASLVLPALRMDCTQLGKI